MRFHLSLLFVAVVLVAACGDEPSTETGSDDVDPVTTAALSDDPIPVEPDGGIGDTPLGDIPFFGANDTLCPSLTLANDADDEQTARDAGKCFLDAVGAGTPVVWDVSIPTIEGDPIYHRFHFTGDDVVIVRDDRADTFGSGSVQAERCSSVSASDAEWLPVGVDCTPTDHPGFPEAEIG
jgi:hypothetical protein